VCGISVFEVPLKLNAEVPTLCPGTLCMCVCVFGYTHTHTHAHTHTHTHTHVAYLYTNAQVGTTAEAGSSSNACDAPSEDMGLILSAGLSWFASVTPAKSCITQISPRALSPISFIIHHSLIIIPTDSNSLHHSAVQV